ncbi:hypothetical protein [Convivina praedatoris]|nr:hypothetical protein [Convivina sp. LMG 32447]
MMIAFLAECGCFASCYLQTSAKVSKSNQKLYSDLTFVFLGLTLLGADIFKTALLPGLITIGGAFSLLWDLYKR